MAFYGGIPRDPTAGVSRNNNIQEALRTQVRQLERTVQRMELEHRALWELVRDSSKLTDTDLETRVRGIDSRDGSEDGKITNVPLRCPNCKRVSSSKHWKCMYCGMEFEKFRY